MSTPPVTTERRDGVLIVHIDDGKANALSFEVIAAVNEAIGEAEADESIGALVINGRPGRFSAGFDLGVMFGDDMSAIIDLVADGGALVHRLYGCQVPVVAACTGHALAAGALRAARLRCARRRRHRRQGRVERGGDQDGAARLGLHDRG